MSKPALNPLPEDAVVRVHSASQRSTAVYVNQRKVDVPHNTDFPLAGPYVEALTNSSVNFTIVRALEAGEKPAGADVDDNTVIAGPAPGEEAVATAGGQKPGGDSLDHAPPANDLSTVLSGGPKIQQKPGGDNMTHAAPDNGSTTGEERRLAEESARTSAAASAAGLTPPAMIMTNIGDGQTQDVDAVRAEADQARAEAGLDGAKAPSAAQADEPEALDVETILNGTVPEVLEHANSLNADQRAELLAAEKKRGQPRKGILDGLAAE